MIHRLFKYFFFLSLFSSLIFSQSKSSLIINNIFFNHTGSDSLILTRYFNELKGDELIEENINYTINKILDYYEETGYPFAEIKIIDTKINYDSSESEYLADITFNITPDKLSKINNIRITGNDKTKPHVILRALRLNSGEIYSQKRINEIPKRLNRLRIFEPVDLPVYYLDPDSNGILEIKVKEKVTNNFDGIVGYVPSQNDNQKGFFTGFVNIGLRNLFGTGRDAFFKWQQEERNSQELQMKYLEPWLFGFPFNAGFELYQRKQDSTYVQRFLKIDLEYLATEDISAGINFSTQSTIPSVRVNKVFTLFNSSELTTGAFLKIDTRDDFYSPRKGFYLFNSYKISSKKINGPVEFITPEMKTKLYLQRIEIDLLMYYELFNNNVAALGLHAKELKGDSFEVSDLYSLGGTNSLRGYRERQFLGHRIFWSNLEYRLLIEGRSFVFVFFDTGYFLYNTSGFFTGYGIGINVETGLGVLTVNYALAKGDSFSNGKIHFGILSEF
ncbi:MAG: BamA/TamA family outer membrane protein [Melioribacteraceae bacterium]|nr:BamA/TamA family outer membrane protein [Melioribacteraceae bacterium]